MRVGRAADRAPPLQRLAGCGDGQHGVPGGVHFAELDARANSTRADLPGCSRGVVLGFAGTDLQQHRCWLEDNRRGAAGRVW